MNKRIRALVMEVDGTLTDGGIYIGNNGEILKKFHVRDGYAIHDLLPGMGIIPIIITGRTSEIVKYRCEELGITHVIQGSRDKVSDLKDILAGEQISLEETAFIGDDLNDLQCMQIVGMKGCPNDAASEIKEIADYVSGKMGGEGAVRDFVEWIREQYVGSSLD